MFSLFVLKVIKVKQSDDKFEVTLDVPQYKPEELKVTVINNILSIEGAHNEAKKGMYKDWTKVASHEKCHH